MAVILNWNEMDLTRRCVASLLTQKHVSIDLLIVDNHSTDGSASLLCSEFPGIIVIHNPKNLGVAGGRNIGIRYAIEHGYKYILLFDNDAYADSEMMVNLIAAARQHPKIGIMGPKILRADQTEVIWRAGCTSWKWTYLHAGCEILYRVFHIFNIFPPSLFDTARGADQPDEGQYDMEIDIAFQIGCAQLIKTDVFRKVGLLDQEFSPYGSEDIDFCIRANRAGWRIRYVPKARCWHRTGGSFIDEYPRSFYNNRNIMLLARKNLSFLYFWVLFIPDFIFLKLPLMFLENIVNKAKLRQRALIDAILWNLNDIRARGILIKHDGRSKSLR